MHRFTKLTLGLTSLMAIGALVLTAAAFSGTSGKAEAAEIYGPIAGPSFAPDMICYGAPGFVPGFGYGPGFFPGPFPRPFVGVESPLYYGGYGVPFYPGNPYGNVCFETCASAFNYFGFQVVCSGPPASVVFHPEPDEATCGSQSNLTITVRDAGGRLVGDLDTQFTTTMGYISSPDTENGVATASLVIPGRQAGFATVTANVGGVVATKTLFVSC